MKPSLQKFSSVRIIVFSQNDYLIHSIIYPKTPTVASLKAFFEELRTDSEFAIEHIDDCEIEILTLKDYIDSMELFKDFDLEGFYKTVCEIVELSKNKKGLT